MKIYYIGLIVLALFLNFKQNKPIKYKATHANIAYFGRYETVNDSVFLISPGASLSVQFTGNQCIIYVQAEKKNTSNYISLELDGIYLERIKITNKLEPYSISIPTKSSNKHILKVFKESEIFNGAIIFTGLNVETILPKLKTSNLYIEFIGDSITCGAAADDSIIPCNEGDYFDHENVYYSYAPTLSRALQADFALSSISGIGMYRNWNDENKEEPIMPQVYENLWLNTDNTKKYDFTKRIPDIINICLGTNDLSKGDGTKSRLNFNKEKYISNYVQFIKMLYKHYPDTQIVLLNSPMITGKDNKNLVNYLNEIRSLILRIIQKSLYNYFNIKQLI